MGKLTQQAVAQHLCKAERTREVLGERLLTKFECSLQSNGSNYDGSLRGGLGKMVEESGMKNILKIEHLDTQNLKKSEVKA